MLFSRDLNSLVFKVAEERGFYKENGLRVLTIAAPLQTGIVGLIGESFDFSQILGSGSATILKGGAPLKIVMVFDQRPLTWMFGAKGIRNMSDVSLAFSSHSVFTTEVSRVYLPGQQCR